MTDKKEVQDVKKNDPRVTAKSEGDDGPTSPPTGPEPPKSSIYLFSGIAAGTAWLISPHVKDLHTILWWILPFLFFLLGIIGYFNSKK